MISRPMQMGTARRALPWRKQCWSDLRLRRGRAVARQVKSQEAHLNKQLGLMFKTR